MGAANPVKFWAYVFVPRELDRARRHPLLVFPHGGVHASFTTYYTHILREMMAQGYVVWLPSTAARPVTQGFYEKIDYGGLEVEDNHAARDYMVRPTTSWTPAASPGGWSHGGLIARSMPSPIRRTTSRFAGVRSPTCRAHGYYDDEYRDLFRALPPGQDRPRDVAEYAAARGESRREARVPLLVHTNTSDDDVYVLEVEHLIAALKAAGKQFEYEIFRDAPVATASTASTRRRARDPVPITASSPVTCGRSGLRVVEELSRASYR